MLKIILQIITTKEYVLIICGSIGAMEIFIGLNINGENTTSYPIKRNFVCVYFAILILYVMESLIKKGKVSIDYCET